MEQQQHRIGYHVKDLCGDPNCGQPLRGHAHTARCKAEFIRSLLFAFPEVATSHGRLTTGDRRHLESIFARWTGYIIKENDLERIPLLVHLRKRAAAQYIWAALTVRGVSVRRPKDCIGLPPPPARRMVTAPAQQGARVLPMPRRARVVAAN
jgi:hypothetical protein